MFRAAICVFGFLAMILLMILLSPANEVWGKVIFSVACVKNSVHGGCLPQCMLGYHPREQTPPRSRPPWSRHPPGADTPWEQTPPGANTPHQEQTPPTRSKHPPRAVHAGRYGQQAGGMHPTGMQSCFT